MGPPAIDRRSVRPPMQRSGMGEPLVLYDAVPVRQTDPWGEPTVPLCRSAQIGGLDRSGPTKGRAGRTPSRAAHSCARGGGRPGRSTRSCVTVCHRAMAIGHLGTDPIFRCAQRCRSPSGLRSRHRTARSGCVGQGTALSGPPGAAVGLSWHWAAQVHSRWCAHCAVHGATRLLAPAADTIDALRKWSAGASSH